MVYLVSALAWLLSLIPPRLAAAMARPIAWLVWRLARRLRTVSLVNIGLCYPELGQDAQKKMAREAMVHYVRSGFEIGISWYWSPARSAGLFLEPLGMDIFEQAVSAGEGVLVLCPHIAAWELLGQSVHEQITGALYKPGGHPEIEAKIIRNRERFGIQLAPANRQGLKTIYGFLQDNKAVIILPDQEPRQGVGVFAPFFNVPALTGVLATRMLRKTKAKAVFAGCMRCPDGRYRVHFQAADEDIYSDDNEISAAAVNRGVEGMIALDPAQYLWAYKRFRTRPGDGPRFY